MLSFGYDRVSALLMSRAIFLSCMLSSNISGREVLVSGAYADVAAVPCTVVRKAECSDSVHACPDATDCLRHLKTLFFD